MPCGLDFTHDDKRFGLTFENQSKRGPGEKTLNIAQSATDLIGATWPPTNQSFVEYFRGFEAAEFDEPIQLPFLVADSALCREWIEPHF